MYKKTGYLQEPLKLFYVQDTTEWICPYHYHDFHKITFFLQGNVTYEVEGKSYLLKPYDIICVAAGQLHRPIISDQKLYERIIAYIAPEWLYTYQQKDCDFFPIFAPSHAPVLRQSSQTETLADTIRRLRQTWYEGQKNKLLKDTIFLEAMLYLSEGLKKKTVTTVKLGNHNEKIQQIMSYIHCHLKEKLTIPILAEQFYVSPDHLMHLFKKETGYSVGTYITTQRLVLAKHYMNAGLPLTEICYECGFTQYSTFYRAWKKYYRTKPRDRGSSVIEDRPLE